MEANSTGGHGSRRAVAPSDDDKKTVKCKVRPSTGYENPKVSRDIVLLFL